MGKIPQKECGVRFPKKTCKIPLLFLSRGIML